jgi:hypothetical protein
MYFYYIRGYVKIATENILNYKRNLEGYKLKEDLGS